MIKIPHNKPSLDHREINAVSSVISSGWIAQGKRVSEFENRICEYIGLEEGHAAAVANGTAALYLALKVLDISLGDEVLVPTYVCTAVLNAVNLAGAAPILVDIDATDFNISYEGIKSRMTGKTKAVIVPYAFGMPADVNKIMGLGIKVIEDCAQALGSRINERYLGTFGDVSILSFYASKVITTGHGGMLLTGSPDLAAKARDYIDFDCREGYYPRFNFQMTDLEAAMGLSQMDKIQSFLENRKRMAEYYIGLCNEKGWDYQRPVDPDFNPNWYRFVVRSSKGDIEKLREHLQKAGISSIIPIEQWELLHNYLKLAPSNFETAEKVTESTLSLPIYPELLNTGEFEIVLEALRRF